MARLFHASVTRAPQATRAHPRLEGLVALFVALVYAGLSALVVLEWAGTTASFGDFDLIGVGD